MNGPRPDERTAATILVLVTAPGLLGAVGALINRTEETPGWWSAAVLVGVCVSTALLALAALDRVPARHGAVCFLGTITLAMLTLRWVSDMTYSESVRPWIEVLVPSAVAAAALVSRVWQRAAVVGVLPIVVHLWLQLRPGWEITPTRIVTDTVFNLTLLGVALALVLALASSQAQLQREAALATASYVRARTAEQLSRHNARWDALIHDRVLAALETVTRASTADEARATARAAAHQLVEGPSREALDAVGLRDELLQAVLSVHPLAETRFPSRTDDEAVPIPAFVGHALATGVSEALRNAIRHAYAGDELGPVIVELRHDSSGVRLCVQDHGIGFRREHLPPTSFGVALSIENRMDAIGGRGVVTSTPGAGTKVELSWAPRRRR